MLEGHGFATTLITLVREHTEKINPPRALWVPFELGRPLGAPNDPAFQRKVLLASLQLLEAESGPVLVDFDEDTPGRDDNPEWAPPFVAPPVVAGDLLENFEAEIAALDKAYINVVASGGRAVVGLSNLDPHGMKDFLLAFMRGQTPDNPRPDCALRDAVRAVTEDLKAVYHTVALSHPQKPSSEQIANWFWGDTVCGQLLLELIDRWSQSEERWQKTIAAFLILPAAQIHRRKPKT